MDEIPSSDRELYRVYRAEVERERMPRAARNGALIVAVLFTAFLAVDWVVFPEHFGLMLGLRLFCNFVMAVIFFWAARAYPLPSSIVGCLTVGLMLLTVIALAGGATSDYSPGLMLLFLGMPVLLPFTAYQAGGVIAVLSSGLALLPIITGEKADLESYFVHLCFPLAAGIEGVIATGLLDRMRFADFKQRREIEQARDELKELDREKSRFTANVHHELRTPLTLMLAPLEAMLGGEFGEVSELQAGYLKTMHTNAQRLLKLINNLLDLAKVEDRRLGVKRRPTQIGRLIEGLVDGAFPLAERKGVVLERSGLGDLPIVNVDPEALEKIVVNLLGNALKFTPAGGRIELSGSEESDAVHLVVADTGVGIPEDKLEHIFDRFAQVDSSSTRQFEGTGIGLALVKELVALHGGRIWAESQGIGQGAQIHLTLPIGAADVELEEEVLQTSAGQTMALHDSLAAIESEIEFEGGGKDELRLVEMQRSVERSDFGSLDEAQLPAPQDVPPDAPEVLIVEDNADMRRLLAFLIGREYRVRLARNGREALERIGERPVDLILTDIMMPEMSGTELCNAVKNDPRTRTIPVVLVTSKAEREMKVEGLELGADDYVTKPFHPRELMARVRSLVRLHRLQAEIEERNIELEQTNEELEKTLSALKEAEVQIVQAERLAAVGELAAGVAHEVNNPVNFATNALKTLRAYVDDIRKVISKVAGIDWGDPTTLQARAGELHELQDQLDLGDMSDSFTELVGIVTEGLERTHRLVGDLRDFASPGDGRRVDVDIRRGLASTAQLVGYTARQAGANLEVDLTEPLPPVAGDARALNQVFLNLLKNAAEALEGRGGSISVSARVEGSAIVVEIRDDGPGIAPELQGRLFEPFVSTKDAGRGAGLGLSISRRILAEHGGSIEIDSSPGEGTTATVRLPVRDGNRAA